MKNSFEVSMGFFRKIQQFFMIDFLHSKFPKMRWIYGMSRAVVCTYGAVEISPNRNQNLWKNRESPLETLFSKNLEK